MSEFPIDTVHQLMAIGRITDAVALLARSVSSGDPEALFQMAVWQLIGHPVPRDLAGARRLLARARAQRHEDATLFEIALTANGTGAPADWGRAVTLLEAAAGWSMAARAQHDLLRRMALDQAGNPTALPTGTPLDVAGRILHFRDFATRDECAHVAQGVADILRPASVVDPATGRMVTNPIRTSDAAVVGPTREDLVTGAINRRIARASNTDVAQGEALTVLRYAPGQEFRLHSDAIAGARNQRSATLLLYLNADFTGGETVFPDLDVTVRPRAGDAILFRNIDGAGRSDPQMRHAGLPIRSGTKWLATRWIRERRFSPWTGPDRPL